MQRVAEMLEDAGPRAFTDGVRECLCDLRTDCAAGFGAELASFGLGDAANDLCARS